MIQRLKLQNWRAYDELDLELGPGATFIVASNGIGKTSLMMAAAWGMFGDAAGVKGADEIRGDASTANVSVELRLPSGAVLTITRSMDRRGRATVEAVTGDRSFASDEELASVFAEEFRADPRVLAQLTFMIHGGLHETQGEFTLRDHLAGLFGVRPLFEAAALAEAVAADAAKQTRTIKLVERKDQREASELAADLAAAETEMAAGRAAREAALVASNEAAERLRAAEGWVTYRAALAERDAKLAAYAEAAAAMLERDVEPEEALDALTAWETEVDATVAEAEGAAAVARGKAEFISEAIAHLDSSDATCPTCLRPFAEHEAEHAAAEHARRLEELDATIAGAQERAAKQRSVLATLRTIIADIRSIPVPVEPAAAEDPDGLEAIRAAHERARDQVQSLDQTIAMHAASAQATRDVLDEIERTRDTATALEEQFRLEGIARAAARTLRETAERIMEQQVEPLVAEVARRWKQTFGKGGLHLSPDGRITRAVGGRTLAFGALSGGERVWALLVTRLLVAGASTRAPFIWLDEPLEHLDPRLRRIVAGTLAMASTRAGLRQVVVTTYEAPIAQQLMEDVPSASLLFVTSAE